MLRSISIVILILIATLPSSAQTELIVPDFLKLPEDTVLRDQLISDINGFLVLAQSPNEDNKYVMASEKVETYILIDEFKEIEASRKFKDEHYYKPYLTNIVSLDSNIVLVQISFIGNDDDISYTRAAFSLLAHKTKQGYLFSSPLKTNTEYFQLLQVGSTQFFYRDSLNIQNVIRYIRLTKEFDEKLKVKDKLTKMYLFNNRPELLKMIGVDYKLDYNGKSRGVYNAISKNEKLIISGSDNEYFNTFDPHDLWHDRLSLVVSRRKVNKPVDEGCAYLYGGSWGYSWEEIFERFLDSIDVNKNTDWKYYKENPRDFGETQAKHLLVDYVINALIIERIEEEVGFSGVWELLNSGVYEKGNENYYQALNRIIGISKENYNEEVWKLIMKHK